MRTTVTDEHNAIVAILSGHIIQNYNIISPVFPGYVREKEKRMRTKVSGKA